MNTVVFFLVMVAFGIFFNAMNILVYRADDLYLSLTLVYSGLFMASMMFIAHELINFINKGSINVGLILIGVFLSSIFGILLRSQFCVNERQWLKRMISHHSTAITTTTKLLQNNPRSKFNKPLYALATNIINTQKDEIKQMKDMLNILKV